MDIKRAKKEIKDSIEAYLAKDEYGDYMIPSIRQRPILLMGPPGIGKTQVMEQVAKECKVALVAYTITHHTRQSAVGLPFIEKKVYSGKEYSVTEYTMSEIVASVYDCMERTGKKEGILFREEQPMSNKLIDLIDISKSYGMQTVLDELNLYIRENEFLTLLGPSGCGKTTTLRILGGFEIGRAHV